MQSDMCADVDAPSLAHDRRDPQTCARMIMIMMRPAGWLLKVVVAVWQWLLLLLLLLLLSSSSLLHSGPVGVQSELEASNGSPRRRCPSVGHEVEWRRSEAHADGRPARSARRQRAGSRTAPPAGRRQAARAAARPAAGVHQARSQPPGWHGRSRRPHPPPPRQRSESRLAPRRLPCDSGRKRALHAAPRGTAPGVAVSLTTSGAACLRIGSGSDTGLRHGLRADLECERSALCADAKERAQRELQSALTDQQRKETEGKRLMPLPLP